MDFWNNYIEEIMFNDILKIIAKIPNEKKLNYTPLHF